MSEEWDPKPETFGRTQGLQVTQGMLISSYVDVDKMCMTS